MILTVETTNENQKVNLGYHLGRWNGSYTEIPSEGSISWDEGEESTEFHGNEGTEETESNTLFHTYTKNGEHKITIEGVVKWNNAIDVLYSDDNHLLSKILKKIEIPAESTSPIYGVNNQSFEKCELLESIPTNLFENCSTDLCGFSGCFADCKSLKQIPNTLFDNCTNVDNFSSCFYNCEAITTVPNTLFSKCTKVQTFGECFNNCTNLTTIPEDLFASCTKTYNFNNCFNSCTQLSAIPSKLFEKCTNANNFNYCFNGCSGVKKNLPELWTSFPKATHTSCFTGCTQASNYEIAQQQGWA